MTTKTKQCVGCKEEKTMSMFGKNKSQKDGLHYYCKECRKTHSRNYYEKNKERIDDKNKAYYHENKEKWADYCKRWAENNRGVMAAASAKYRAFKSRADYSEKEAVDYVYYAAKVIEKVYGTKWHVDHIVPLQGENVCGLHVSYNLQLLSPSDNCRKGNRFR